jgi:hypothetical protein
MADVSRSMPSESTLRASASAFDLNACIACSLIAIGAIGTLYGLMRPERSTRRWPAVTEAAPWDFTPPHGDKLLQRR